jgi:ApbE superfamily uncharacterized protein (UPF0280 family)
MKYEPRTYRNISMPEGLVQFNVLVQETDLSIYGRHLMKAAARELVLESRGIIEKYILQFPHFARTLSPWTINGPAPWMIRKMAEAGKNAGVGPMAAVAGVVAEHVGRGLLKESTDVIVENGGDIFIRASQPVTVGILAGDSPLSGKIGVRLSANTNTMAICTSSGLVGPSLSKGRAEAVSIVSRSCPLADAAATAVANHVQTKKDLQPAVDIARSISGVEGVVIIKGDAVALWGDLDIVPV